MATFGQFIDNFRDSETDHGNMGLTLDAAGGSRELIGVSEDGGGYSISQNALREDVGFYRPPSNPSERYQRNLNYAQDLIESAMRGNKYKALKLQEALTTSDFGSYFGDVLYRSVLANYAETPYSWDMYCKRAIINDFRQTKMFRVDRGAAVLDGPIIPNSYGATGAGPTGLQQLSEYPLRRRVMSAYVDQLYKFGCRMDFAFETIVNDDLDALKDTPALFGRAARRTEEKRATELFATSGGPNASFFSNANKNLINSTVLGANYTGLPNPPFSLDALKWALVVMASQRDLDGEPISIEAATLVYPPALMSDVRNALGAEKAFFTMQGGNALQNVALNAITSGITLFGGNWAKDIVQGALNYYLPVVDTTYGNQAWYLFASPKNGRPALQLSFLRGREMAEMSMKLPNQVSIGEGRMGPGAGVMPGTMNSNPMEGDFDTDAIDYRVRSFIGGTLLDPVLAVASNGSGT